MHMEFRQFYGTAESDVPDWMKWDEIELIPLELRQVICGVDGTEFGGWMPLYRYNFFFVHIYEFHTYSNMFSST